MRSDQEAELVRQLGVLVDPRMVDVAQVSQVLGGVRPPDSSAESVVHRRRGTGTVGAHCLASTPRTPSDGRGHRVGYRGLDWPFPRCSGRSSDRAP
jgi:hypothetical protein